jgi:hypothetical protein
MNMRVKKLLQCLLIATAVMAVNLPGQAAMVDTAQLQANQVAIDFGSIAAQRDWIKEQLVVGGVDAVDASLRVAALTDAQVLKIHQRIDKEPAGGNILVIIFLILVITELMGVTDIIPNWPSK